MLEELCGPPVYAVEGARGQPIEVRKRLAGEIAALAQGCLGKKADEPESCVCAICQDVFVEPVTLPCGHSFDRRCLLSHLELRSDCPLCRKPVSLPLPEINYSLRDLVKEVCPVRASARAAELRDQALKPEAKRTLLTRVLGHVEDSRSLVGIVSTVTALGAATAASVLLSRA